MKKKICIILDNPTRDLKGLLLLSLYLIDKFDVYLVEQYNKREIYLLKPSLVIFHNARKNNITEIKNCKKNNIYTCLLDTEGGYDAFGIMKEIINNELKKNLNYIDLYFCWGKYMYRNLKQKISNNQKNIIKLTGSPKGDLIYFFSKMNKTTHTDILFNTSFPIIDARYGNKLKTVNSFKSELDYISAIKKNRYLKGAKNNQHEFIKLIKNIANDYKDKIISIRVHPFESTKKYDILCNEYSNIYIIKDDENLNDTLKKSKVLIHYNCTTSFEFFLLKKHKTLMPNFFTSFKYLKCNDYIKKSSILCNSYDQLKKSIDVMLNKSHKYKNNNSSKIQNSLNEVFYKIDGKSSEKISKNISKLKFNVLNNNKNFSDNFFFNNSVKEKIINIFYYFDPLYYRYLRNLVSPWKLRSKELNLKLISSEIKDLKKLINVRKKVIIKRAFINNSDIPKINKTFAFELTT